MYANSIKWACRTLLLSLQFTSCSKPEFSDTTGKNTTELFDRYLIPAGEHYCTQSVLRPSEYGVLKFQVKFDSSAIYTTTDPLNQFDINKLYGFGDNNSHHHEFSARIGWRWCEGALQLLGYVYNHGELSYEEITEVSIGQIQECAITVADSNYIFSINGKIKTMLRTSPGTVAHGFKLYPYFGGDEPAPHDIHIWIKEK